MKALVQTILNATAAGKSMLLAANSAAQKVLLSLGNVDNTSDANKPVSTAQQTALNAKAAAAITITAGVGLSGGGDLSTNRTIDLEDTAVTPGSYTATNLTVDAQGRITAAANGSGGAGVTTLNTLTGATQTFATGTSGTDHAIVSSGTSHTWNLPDASVTARGVVTTGTQTIAGAKTFTNGIESSGITSVNNYIASVTGVAAKSCFRTISGGGSFGQFFTGANESNEAVRFDNSVASIGVTYDCRNGISQVNYHAFTSGGTGTYPMTLQMLASGSDIGVGINILSGGRYQFSNSATIAYASADTAIGRDSAGVVGVYTSATGSTKAGFVCGAMTADGLMCCGVYTFATVPSASSNAGKFLRITDRAQKHAYSDGTNWRFFGDDAIIS